jgi:hypothetical protein
MPLKIAFEWYKSFSPNFVRLNQLTKIIGEIEGHFNLEEIICIETGASQNWEDGCVGAFLAKFCELTNGKFHSVDLNPKIVEDSKTLYKELGFTNTFHYIDDSIHFLENTPIIPNLVHLDSWDLDLKNPFPSALHGWREFVAIEDKMPINSLLIVDDNFFGGTWVSWKDYGGDWEKLDISYPIVGKGSHIYDFIKSGESNWEKISTDVIGQNEKLVFKKIK